MHYLKSNKFQKFERLSGKRSVAFLFEHGQSFILSSLKIIWITTQEQQFPVTVLFSVSKKNFPLSPDRNRIKRLLREAYRLNKTQLIKKTLEKNENLQIAFIYLGKTLPEYMTIEEKMISALKKIQDALETNL